MSDVSKIVIRIDGFAEPTLLMSRKKAKGTPKHGKLELLGGGNDGQEAMQGLLRELEEEEKSGRLAEVVRSSMPGARIVTVDDTTHYVFEVTISLDDYIQLRHTKKESLGFKAIPQARIADPTFRDRLTKRTQAILGAFGVIAH